MTRGYFVLEQAGAVVKAAYLSGDAYLQYGHGQEIIEAYAKGNEMKLLEELHKRTDIREIAHIRPGWYRKTAYAGKDDSFEEYGYVLTDSSLSIYNYGKLLFRTNKEHAKIWLEVINSLDRFELAYLYSEDKLCYHWNQYRSMFRDITSKINDGKSFMDLEQLLKDKNYIPSLLKDDHLIDVFSMPGRPAYQKWWNKGDASATFIVIREYGKWKVFLQLHFCRIPILSAYNSEKKAVEAIRQLLISKEPEMESFSEVVQLIEKYKTNPVIQEKDLMGLRKLLENKEQQSPWFAHEIRFTIDWIIEELLRRMRRRIA